MEKKTESIQSNPKKKEIQNNPRTELVTVLMNPIESMFKKKTRLIGTTSIPVESNRNSIPPGGGGEPPPPDATDADAAADAEWRTQ